MTEQTNITLKEFKRKIKAIGYKFKTHVVDFSSMGFRPHRHLEILDQNKNYVCGGGSICTEEHIKKHQVAFDLIREYKGRVFDEENDKVLF